MKHIIYYFNIDKPENISLFNFYKKVNLNKVTAIIPAITQCYLELGNIIIPSKRATRQSYRGKKKDIQKASCVSWGVMGKKVNSNFYKASASITVPR